ncbi:MAG: FKBP-type peptidyl-prolyl cis-trans isomerase FkpA [Flavobacteriales bacterium]|jgi:FKBP-type peptidyl-prolyl cis-trans isomerase FkpA
MKKLVLPILALSVALVGCGGNVETKKGAVSGAELALTTTEQKVSYVLGVSLSQGIDMNNFEFDITAFQAGMNDLKSGGEPLYSREEMAELFKTFQSEQLAKAGAKSEEDGKAYLVENAKKDGVVTTESGLQYEVLVAGEGDLPKATDFVSVNYTGTLLDGTEFDSSIKRGKPAEFQVSNLIDGWVEALQLMPVGSKWKLTIPASLAYGEHSPPTIPPNSTLQFEMELLSIKAPAKSRSTGG